MDRLRADLIHTWRSLKGRSGSSLAMTVILALGIGFTTTVFALADPFLLRPLPFVDDERLAVIRVGPTLEALRSGTLGDVPTLADWQMRTDLFAGIAAYGESERWRLTGGDGGSFLTVRTVSSNFSTVLGLAIRRPISWDPEPAGAARPLILTERAANRLRTAGRLAGTSVSAENGTQFQLRTVLPDDFLFPTSRVSSRPEALSPSDFGPVVERASGSTRSLTMLARLQPGVEAQMVALALGGPTAEAGIRLDVEPLRTHMVSGLRPLATGALAAGLLIALVCAANVINLVVARCAYRGREFATREALGASTIDLLRLLVWELTALTAAAVLLGLALANGALAVTQRLIPEPYQALGQPEITSRAGAFAFLLGATILAASVFPAWLSSRSAAVSSISRAQFFESFAMRWIRFGMAAGQAAIAMLLLVGAALLLRSYANLWLQDTGYSSEARVVSVSYPRSSSGSQLGDVVSSTLADLRRTPGLASVAAAVGTGSLMDDYSTVGGPLIRVGEETFRLAAGHVSPEYFDVVGSRLVAGRTLGPDDRGWTVVINEAFARRVWPDSDVHEAVGQAVVANGTPGQIVGVVQNTHDRALDLPPVIRIFRPLELGASTPRRLNYVLRLAAASLPEPAIRRAILGRHPDAVVEGIDAIDGRLAETVRDRTFATLVIALFAIAGLGVAATGVFGVVAFVVARRTREIAVHVVMGAQPRQVQRWVMRDAARATLLGTIVGLAAGRLLARTLEGLLYGVQAGDLTAPGLAAVALVAVAAVAAWLPTRRALGLEPTLALRAE